MRVTAEQLHSERHTDSSSSFYDLYSFSMPIGFQLLSKSKKWKFMLMGIPRISSDYKNAHYNDLQIGGLGLVTYEKNPNLKFKLGLYFNREFFGDFFVPFFGMDWKVNDRFSMYGLLPNNYRLEFKLNKHFYNGLGFKSFQRSYRLANEWNDDFVWVREASIKAFLDIYMSKNLILFGDIGYTLNYRLVQYQHENVKTERNTNLIYTPFENNLIFSAGFSYRIRKD